MRPIFTVHSPSLHSRIRRLIHVGLSALVALSVVVGALPAGSPLGPAPAHAAPAALVPFVEVAAPDINCIFDLDCKITVNDLADHFVPPAASGDAFLQSRLWPIGEAGTPGQGLYAYLYRIDLRNAVGITAASCVTSMRIQFGPIVPMDYNGDGNLEQAFVVTKGGIGNVKPTAIEQFGSTLLIHFQDPPICVGSSQGNGDSSYFIGFASKTPHHDVTADLDGTLGLAETLDAWAPRIRRATHVRIAESNNKLFKATFELSPALLLPATQGQMQFTQFMLPDVDPNGHEPGLPDVPVVRRLLAIPRGADVRVSGVEVKASHHMTDVIVYPSQPSPVDVVSGQRNDEPPTDGFADAPFEFNAEAYRSDTNYPEQWVDVVPMGRMRDLDLVQLSVAAGQFNPAKRTLEIAESIAFEIHFEGGEEGFLPRERMNNPFDTSFDAIYAQTLNHQAVTEYPFPGNIVANICWGHEYLIITHPDFRPAADDLRNHKVARGLSTQVYETGNGAGQIGSAKEQVRDFIRNKFDTCVVRPSYVLLLGDAEKIPTFYRDAIYGEDAGTDLDYSLMNNADILPDLAYGRIPVDTPEQAQIVIDKIIAYEATPPFNGAFYSDATFAAYFQCCRPEVAQDGTASRSFIETAELVRDELEALGYDVERIYNTSTDYHDTPGESSYYNPARDDTPNRYYNGTLLPPDLRASSGYPWNGDTDDVIDAINDGRFLVLHRDHGWTDGWGDPAFNTSDLGDLTNGSLTPVVYSINCASGLFDNETLNAAQQAWPYSNAAGYVSWAEELLRMEGGAVGIIGDTRVSPTWANSALTRGLFDATWPSVLPAQGGANSIKRLGDILNYGKAYLVGQVGVAQTAGSIFNSDANVDVILYHVLGDPTMTMYTSNPWQIFLPKFYYEIEIPKPWEIWRVKYPVNGAFMTALQEGNPVARAPIANGEAMLNFIHEVDPDLPIELSVQHPDGTSVALGGPDTHGQITPDGGGTLKHAESLFELKFDPGAVPGNTDVLYTLGGTGKPLPADLIGLLGFQLEAFDSADGDGSADPITHFDKPYTMLLGYEEDDLSGEAQGEAQSERMAQAIDETTLGVHYYDEADGTWKPLACSVDTDANQVSCQADHFTEFALTGKPKADEPITPQQSIFLPMVRTTP